MGWLFASYITLSEALLPRSHSKQEVPFFSFHRSNLEKIDHLFGEPHTAMRDKSRVVRLTIRFLYIFMKCQNPSFYFPDPYCNLKMAVICIYHAGQEQWRQVHYDAGVNGWPGRLHPHAHHAAHLGHLPLGTRGSLPWIAMSREESDTFSGRSPPHFVIYRMKVAQVNCNCSSHWPSRSN